MIPLTLLCLALFALAWGYRTAFKRASQEPSIAIAIAADWSNRGLEGDTSDFVRPMSCDRIVLTSEDINWLMDAAFLPDDLQGWREGRAKRQSAVVSVREKIAAKSLSLDDLMRSGKADG